jgi:hypothetical protein
MITSERSWRRVFTPGMKGEFEFLGGPKDGQVEGVPLDWLRCRISGADYVLAVIEREVTPEQPVGFDYVLVHKPLIPKAD